MKKKKRKEKPTAFEIAELIIKAIVAIAALITAIKWWQAATEGRKPLPLAGVGIGIISQRKEFCKWVKVTFGL